MAKQKGMIPLVGTLGGINFYYLNGKPVARVAGGGFNGKAIKTKASMRRVRENGSEFGHCSRVNKAFRLALRPFYKGHTFTHFHSRLMGLFTALKDLDAVHERGKRMVYEGAATAAGASLLKGYDYTPACDVRAVLPFGLTVDSGTMGLTLSEIDIKQVKFITGATHVELIYGVLDFDFETLAYDLHLAPVVVLDKGYAGGSIDMLPDTLPSGIGSLFPVLGVRFYQEVDGVLYLLNAKNGVGFMLV